MKAPTIIAQSPGRINIIGEHTDYNDGFVLPAAVDKKTVFQIRKNGTKTKINIAAFNLNDTFSFDLSDYHPISAGWENYIMGVVRELEKLGANFTGFDGAFEGDVPIGSGMSSSAALECSLAFGLNELFNLGFDKWQLIKACQMAEHNFVGIKCGIMDQFASIMGKKNQVMLLDCCTLEFEYFPFDLGHYELLLLNTNISHSLASSEYNTRRNECETGVTIFKKKYPTIHSLRDVTYQILAESKHNLPDNIFKRCRHVVLENNRVLEATKALHEKDFYKLGMLMYQSHASLKDDYEVSCEELDFLVALTKDKDYILGSRMIGGGFGGCTLNVILKEKTKQFIDLAYIKYNNRFGIEPTAYAVAIDDGTSLLKQL